MDTEPLFGVKSVDKILSRVDFPLPLIPIIAIDSFSCRSNEISEKSSYSNVCDKFFADNKFIIGIIANVIPIPTKIYRPSDSIECSVNLFNSFIPGISNSSDVPTPPHKTIKAEITIKANDTLYP